MPVNKRTIDLSYPSSTFKIDLITQLIFGGKPSEAWFTSVPHYLNFSNYTFVVGSINLIKFNSTSLTNLYLRPLRLYLKVTFLGTHVNKDLNLEIYIVVFVL